MPTITDESTIFLLAQPIRYTALYSGTQGSQDFTGIFSDEVGFASVAQLVQFNTTIGLTADFNTYFKVQGYNPLTGTYEVWHCRGTPLLLPPSGHSLLNVSVVASWKER
jgi:hypothetical protein